MFGHPTLSLVSSAFESCLTGPGSLATGHFTALSSTSSTAWLKQTDIQPLGLGPRDAWTGSRDSNSLAVKKQNLK